MCVNKKTREKRFSISHFFSYILLKQVPKSFYDSFSYVILKTEIRTDTAALILLLLSMFNQVFPERREVYGNLKPDKK